MTPLRTTRARAAGLLTVITMTAVLAACSSGSDDVGASDAALGEPSGASAGSDGSRGSSGSDAGGGSAEDGATSRELSGQSGDTTSTATERAIISSGTVSLTSKDVAGARQDVQRIVDAQGGEVTEEGTETDDEGETSYARMVLRVPSSAFDDAMQALEDVEVLRSSNRGSEDVTTQVIDTGVRVRAQQASLKRVELLLAEAKTLKDIIWIESQLTDRQAELDSLKSQQTWLKDQTSLSTITVDITAKPDAKAEEPDEDPAGFLTGLKGGLDALGGTAVAIATVVGALLPFAVVLLVLGLPVWLLLRRRRTAPQPAVPEA
jgi:hypothetical protein